jgi:enediyne biosynthesis protein E4
VNLRPAAALALVFAACTSTSSQVTTTGPEETQGAQGGTTSGPVATVGETGDLSCWTAAPGSGEATIVFSDQTEALGMVTPLTGMYGHAGVWGDFNGDDRPDLFMGTFADRDTEIYQARGATGPAPDRLLIASDASFSADQSLPEMFGRTSGGTVADLDGDGDLDLVVSRNWDDDLPSAPGTQVLRNDEGVLVPAGSGLPAQLAGRSVAVLDYDLDGLLDIFITADDGGSVLMHNDGDLVFSDVTAAVGLPQDIVGLGVAVADLTGDRRQDIFVAGSNQLLIADGDSFQQVDSSVFAWPPVGEEDLVTGVSIADVNRDGLLDIALGHHFNSTVDDGALVPVRLFLNRGDGQFEDVTEAAGLVGLPTKGPHVELNDIDNDGWPDLITTASAADGTRPAVFRHAGLNGDIPTFTPPDGLGSPQYWVAGPTSDIDRDGRLDIFLVEFDPALPSLMLRNETASGHWLEVSAGSELGYGVGLRAEVFESGGAGDAGALLGARDITTTQGYSSGVAPVAHFGLGEVDRVDVRLSPPGDGDVVVLTDVAADQHLRYPAGCS